MKTKSFVPQAHPADDPATRQQFKEFILVLGGHIFFQALSAAAQLDLFSLLGKSGALTRDEIAAGLGLKEKPTRILLLGLVATGILEKKDGRYSNSPIASVFLDQKSPKNMIDIIRWQHFINYKAMFHFHDALLKNKNVGLQEFRGNEPTLYERLAHVPELEQIFQDAMDEISYQASEYLASEVDFSGVKTVVDVGGGKGSNLIQLLKKNAHLQGIVFDSATVCEKARRNIQAHAMDGRIRTANGNCFEDPFPTGADCILFCHFFTIWSEERNFKLLQKAYEALPSGGRVMIFNMMQDDEEAGPLSAAMGSPYFLTLATGEGMLYTWKEYRAWFEKAGFTSVSTQKLPMNHGVIVGVKR